MYANKKLVTNCESGLPQQHNHVRWGNIFTISKSYVEVEGTNAARTT